MLDPKSLTPNASNGNNYFASKSDFKCFKWQQVFCPEHLLPFEAYEVRLWDLAIADTFVIHLELSILIDIWSIWIKSDTQTLVDNSQMYMSNKSA